MTGCAPASIEPETNQAEGHPPSAREVEGFDLQAHRGGRGEFAESSWPAYEHAVGPGVTTLELDIVLTSDGAPGVWPDLLLEREKCRGTAPAKDDDRSSAYVGGQIDDLA